MKVGDKIPEELLDVLRYCEEAADDQNQCDEKIMPILLDYYTLTLAEESIASNKSYAKDMVDEGTWSKQEAR